MGSSVNKVSANDIRKLMYARLGVASGKISIIHTNLLSALGVDEAVEIRLDFLHIVVYDDRMNDPTSPFYGLVSYDQKGEVVWFHPILIEVAAGFNLHGNLALGLIAYFNYLASLL